MLDCWERGYSFLILLEALKSLLTKFTKGVREIKKQISAATTILGPDGVSHASELSSPVITASTPITEAT